MKQSWALGLAVFLPLAGAGQVVESLVFSTPADGRSAALGGVLVADLRPDAHGATWNPALLAPEAAGLVAANFTDYFAGMRLASVFAPIRSRGAEGGAVRTWALGARMHDYGSFAGTDATGAATGSFRGGDYAVSSSWSWRPDSVWSIGVATWAGMRHLERDAVGWAGVDLGVHGRWPHRGWAVGAALTGWGGQFGRSGNWPTGRHPANLQFGIAKGFAHAPFSLYARAGHLLTWDLAPPGSYEDTVDPLTGDTLQNRTWAFGDRLMRHMGLGTELRLSESLRFQIGYDYRRRKELASGGRAGTAGLALGVTFRVKSFGLQVTRATYHFAGSSTHLGVTWNPT